MHIASQPMPETRRVILFDGKKPDVLIDWDGRHCALPEVEIPRWQRAAEHLTAAVRKRWAIDAVSISSLNVTLRDSCLKEMRYEIMEPCAGPRQDALGKRWIAVGNLAEAQFRDRFDFEAVRQARAQCVANAENTLLGSFGALGWFRDLEHWINEEIRTQGLQLNGRFRQLNSCATFSLIRFETVGPAIWFKAVGAPNQREYPVTLALARLFPRFLPQIISTRPESNGWLALEVEGFLLRESPTLAAWEAVAQGLAEIQIESLGTTRYLLDAGARNLQASALGRFLEPFFQAMNELMDRQTKTTPAPLSREALRRLCPRVRDALAALRETNIPDTLGHLDLNPGNIICSKSGSVFLDWAEAFVGHPFLTFQYLLEHFRRALAADPSAEARILSRYSSLWHGVVSESDMRRAFEVAPLVAVFACAVGNDLWSEPKKLEDERIAGYLRSLTRRMEREASTLAVRSLTCPY